MGDGCTEQREGLTVEETSVADTTAAEDSEEGDDGEGSEDGEVSDGREISDGGEGSDGGVSECVEVSDDGEESECVERSVEECVGGGSGEKRGENWGRWRGEGERDTPEETEQVVEDSHSEGEEEEGSGEGEEEEEGSGEGEEEASSEGEEEGSSKGEEDEPSHVSVASCEGEEGEPSREGEEEEETDCVVVEKCPPSPQFKLGSQYRTLYRQLHQTEVEHLSLSLSLTHTHTHTQALLETMAHRLPDGGEKLREQRLQIKQKISQIKKAPPDVSRPGPGHSAGSDDKVRCVCDSNSSSLHHYHTHTHTHTYTALPERDNLPGETANFRSRRAASQVRVNAYPSLTSSHSPPSHSPHHHPLPTITPLSHPTVPWRAVRERTHWPPSPPGWLWSCSTTSVGPWPGCSGGRPRHPVEASSLTRWDWGRPCQ